MAKIKFNKKYKDKELGRLVEANEELDITLKRADEIVETIKKQVGKYPKYKDFGYERLDKE